MTAQEKRMNSVARSLGNLLKWQRKICPFSFRKYTNVYYPWGRKDNQREGNLFLLRPMEESENGKGGKKVIRGVQSLFKTLAGFWELVTEMVQFYIARK